MYAILGDLLIVVHAPINPDPGEWRALMEASRANAHRYGRCLVLAGSVTLTAGQRAELADLVNAKGFRVAVLIDSAVTRGMVTALGWVTGNKYRAFGPRAIDDALGWIGGGLQGSDVQRLVQSMRGQMIEEKRMARG